ncbi:cytochrome c [Chitinophaga pinensis]|uniref:Cytochrome C oxidase mono-heme subunit/FixO n=1 Tax=Chitinophaga pinensis (strain ATCC 43595 / DSM 2588 / LMG 13176 / NBRC 15968 / NCIMB 11800 / UQM 2034) TaxID=485918 RepID=A0A979G5S2_CHIPD|nr:cbb3-type cytochrome c oxidase subunit II [Chitinophaga pinensis]ACU61240.1 cytochrome C oxidase mono-heme subunit/FixO [Chitinophaga pinensis DSM 2588]
MELFDNHKTLYSTALGLFLVLTLGVAILPAISNEQNNAPLPDAPVLSEDAVKGKALFVANGCVACHTQQVRNVEMDKIWGGRPGIAADYADNHRTDLLHNTATLMGTERTGPDLTNVGKRQPSRDWQLVHLFNPRTVVEQSIMPAYSWLFTIKDSVQEGDVVVNVPEAFLTSTHQKVVATREALQLVAYLQSLQQVQLPDGKNPLFLYKREQVAGNKEGAVEEFDGAALYANNCQSCHQPNGEGLKGAFPPLKGSKIVLNDDPELMVDIIMNGYSGRVQEGFGEMPAVGTLNKLSAGEVAAIMNHERSSWGNNGRKVTEAQVKAIMEKVKK